jgi:hypothetical protein
MKCGCGNCCIRKDVSTTCPQELSRDAVWLWHSDFSESTTEIEESEERDPTIIELLQEIKDAPLEY